MYHLQTNANSDFPYCAGGGASRVNLKRGLPMLALARIVRIYRKWRLEWSLRD
jgi:hypothetical protein